MKQILAIIRPQMVNRTRDALVKAGVAAFSFWLLYAGLLPAMPSIVACSHVR